MPDLGNIYELHSFLELNNTSHVPIGSWKIFPMGVFHNFSNVQNFKSLPCWSIWQIASWNNHLFEVCSRRVWLEQTDYSNWRHCNPDHLLVPTQYLVVPQPHWLFKESLLIWGRSGLGQEFQRDSGPKPNILDLKTHFRDPRLIELQRAAVKKDSFSRMRFKIWFRLC